MDWVSWALLTPQSKQIRSADFREMPFTGPSPSAVAPPCPVGRVGNSQANFVSLAKLRLRVRCPLVCLRWQANATEHPAWARTPPRTRHERARGWASGQPDGRRARTACARAPASPPRPCKSLASQAARQPAVGPRGVGRPRDGHVAPNGALPRAPTCLQNATDATPGPRARQQGRARGARTRCCRPSSQTLPVPRATRCKQGPTRVVTERRIFPLHAYGRRTKCATRVLGGLGAMRREEDGGPTASLRSIHQTRKTYERRCQFRTTVGRE